MRRKKKIKKIKPRMAIAKLFALNANVKTRIANAKLFPLNANANVEKSTFWVIGLHFTSIFF